VVHRPQKSGLGTAYIEAFKEVLLQQKADWDDTIIIQMDADLSHDPAAIPEILRKAQNDKCDVVLGSRYIKDGKIENWDFFRKLISRFGNIYARIVLGLPYRDLTGGYKCFRAEVLKNIDLEGLSSVGYNFQIETTYRAHRARYRICEIPISFTERKVGASKFNLGIILESFWKVLLLRFKK
jgi:dolichol-phosphate mannosyltransferase